MDNKMFAMWTLMVAVGLIGVGIYFLIMSGQIGPFSSGDAEGLIGEVQGEDLIGEVQGIDLGNLDSEFQSIDADLGQL